MGTRRRGKQQQQQQKEHAVSGNSLFVNDCVRACVCVCVVMEIEMTVRTVVAVLIDGGKCSSFFLFSILWHIVLVPLLIMQINQQQQQQQQKQQQINNNNKIMNYILHLKFSLYFNLLALHYITYIY